MSCLVHPLGVLLCYEMKINYSLYLITDKKLAGKHRLCEIVLAAIKGGVTIIQYREKNANTAQMVNEAGEIHKITKKFHIPLIINDRIDVALAIDAEGVHVGQDDMPALLARRLIGSEKILGVSVRTVSQAKNAVLTGADYLGIGDIFGSASKPDAGEPIGLETVYEITKTVAISTVGIGGITKKNADSVIAAGADGIAVISAITGKPDPEKEAKELRAGLKKYDQAIKK